MILRVRWKKTGIKRAPSLNRITMQTVKKETNLFLKTVLDIKANGRIIKGMEKELKFGQMELNTKATGKITKLMAFYIKFIPTNKVLFIYKNN